MDDSTAETGNLSPEQKRELLAELLRKKARKRTFPLSFAQQRLWFLDKLQPGSASYNILSGARLTGQLNVEAMSKALELVVRRHDSLRTSFSETDGQPSQLIHPPAPLTLSLLDFSHLPPHERQHQTDLLIATQSSLPFDLSLYPLWRATLLRLDSREHLLLFVIHHIISDGWSMGVLVRELASAYASFAAAESPSLPPLPIQYADFAVWQREWLAGARLAEQLDYWRGQLAGAAPVLELPTDHSRPAVQGYRGARVEISLPSELTLRLEELSREEGATLFMTLLGAFRVLLWRYSGQEDVSIGTPIAGRTQLQTEGLIGFFINTLVLRVEVRGDESFRELVSRERESALGGYGHQEVPFERLVEEMGVERDMSHTPLFQVMFVLQNSEMPVVELPGLKLTPLEVPTTTVNFDIALAMEETEQGMFVAMHYNTDLFDAPTIERMLRHFQIILEGIVADPDRRLSALPLLAEDERRQVLVSWNDTKKDYPAGKRLHELFEAQAERTPDAVALSFEDAQLTYAGLNARANQLARYLRQAGVGADVAVALCLERSLEMVVGLLGILKAGGAYVPLEPNYPKERLAFMIEDARAPVVLTQAHLAHVLPDDGAKVVQLDREWEAIAQHETENLKTETWEDSLAYVIYTSGSTGQPKGAMNTHRGICNRLLWMQDAYGLDPSDSVLQKTPYSFDVSVWEFFWPLITGARLVVARPGGHQDSAYLVRLVAAQKITTLHFVPSMLQVFLEEQDLESCDSLTRVVCSGEALSTQLQARFFERLDAGLYNLYGPTEAAVDVTHWTCERGGSRRSVPIGRPIANTQIYILDAHLQPVPAGVPGELYIGGAGLARGYLRRPDLTAERFVANPFGDEPGARLYRTGDRARFLDGGEIEYLGRTDYQVKIRGFRIELGEIESALGGHAAVREALVMAREDSPGNKRLVAYFVAEPEASASADELRGFLRERLPEYMLPTAFVVLEQFPLTPNGKIDRRQLPAPESGRAASAQPYVAPRTPVEQELAEIWAELLQIERVGIYDNFFELGGHSLLLTQLASRIRKNLQVELPLRVLFDVPTIVEMTTAIAEMQVEQEDDAEVAQMLDELKQLSPEEVKALLEAEG